ncbi:protein cornichon homolog 4-like [Planococcus citri]|uniref:protein cornichon homolog 4-like n=1 Tax=Planococcus citri TaxID=170843 RepID=UPI0031F91A8D
MGQILFFIFSLIDNGFLLLLEIYLVLLLSDLECDYLNPQECCLRLNACVTPRLGAQFLLISLLFISGHWWLSLSNIPLLIWFIYEKMTVPKNNSGVYDLLEIYSRNGVQKHMLKSLLNISWLLVALSFNMYFAMQALLFEDEMQEEQLIKWNNTEY